MNFKKLKSGCERGQKIVPEKLSGTKNNALNLKKITFEKAVFIKHFQGIYGIDFVQSWLL